MATPNSLKETYLEITSGAGAGSATAKFIIQANPENYPTELVAAITGFVAQEPSDQNRKETADVITPVSVLIASGSFRRLYASGIEIQGTKRRTRQVVIPSTGYEAVKSLIETGTGVAIGGVQCTTVSVGQRSTNR